MSLNVRVCRNNYKQLPSANTHNGTYNQDKQTLPVSFFLFNFRMLSVPTRLGRISLLTGYGKIANQDYLIQSTLISIKRTPPNYHKYRESAGGSDR